MNPFKLFGGKDSKSLRLTKSDSGEWMVKRGHSILYIGSREKCEIYIKRTEIA